MFAYALSTCTVNYVAMLCSLSHTLMLVPNLHWIIIEDAEDPSSLVANLLKNSGIRYTHLTAATPKDWKLKEKVCLLCN
jgi:hypothetical protein